MKKLLLLIIISISLFEISLSAQTLESLMDSTKFYQLKPDYETALKWAKKFQQATEKQSNLPDTNYIEFLGKIGDIYDNLGEVDSSFYYFDLCLKKCKEFYKMDHQNLAHSYSNLGDLYVELGKLQDAESMYTQTLEMRKRLFKGDHPDIALGMNKLAVVTKNLGKLKEAEPLYMESYEMNKRLYKGDHADVANSLNNLAVFYHVQGRVKEAVPYFEKAMDMERRLYKEDNRTIANTMLNLAFMYEERGKFNEAEKLDRECVGMYRRIYNRDNPDLAASIQGLAWLLVKMGKNDEAELLYKESSEMNRRLYKEDHPNLALSLSHLSIFYWELGRLDDGIDFAKEALEMNKRMYKGDNQNLALAYGNLAALLTDKGRFKDAEPLFREVIEMNKRLYNGIHPNIALALSNLGSMYKSEGNVSEAEICFKQAIEIGQKIYGGKGESSETAFNNLANLYSDQHKYKEAEQIFKELLDSGRIKYKNGHQNLARILNNLASVYENMDKLTEAETLKKEAVEINRKLFKGDHAGKASTICNLASCYILQKKYSEAEPLFKEALEMRKRILNDYHKDVASNYSGLGYLYELKNDLNSAEPYILQSLESSKNNYLSNYSIFSEKEKEKFWKTMKSYFEDFNNFGIKRMATNPLILRNMYDYQLFTKALLFSSANKIKSRILNSDNDTLKEKFKEWISLKEYIVKLYTLTKTQLEKQNINLDSLTIKASLIEKELNEKSELFAESYEKKNITWRTIQGMLKPDEAAIEIVRFRGDKRKFLDNAKDSVFYAVLIITDQTVEHPDIVLFNEGKEMESTYYDKYRVNIKNSVNDKESYKNYWSKIDNKLKGIKKIYFSPDGIYHKINPETLLKPNGKYLFEEQEILILNTTKDIVTNYFKSKQESSMMNNASLFGNPRFEIDKLEQLKIEKKFKSEKNDKLALMSSEPLRGTKITELPGTEKEIINIAVLLKSKNWIVNSYLGVNALKIAVKSVKNPRVLHIATHGIFLPDVTLEQDKVFGIETKRFIENPLLRSGLLFTGAGNFINDTSIMSYNNDNGVLSAYEAMNLELDHTELVVLSACETGVGIVQNGEGVYGLQRAFQTAGAKSILMSLWTVADQPTNELMTSFYSNWISGMTKRAAFNKAQKEIFIKYKNPYTWGAFVMVGE